VNRSAHRRLTDDKNIYTSDVRRIHNYSTDFSAKLKPFFSSEYTGFPPVLGYLRSFSNSFPFAWLAFSTADAQALTGL